MDGHLEVADLMGDAPEWQERALCSQTDPEAFFRFYIPRIAAK